MTSNVQEFLDIISDNYNKTKKYYENLLMDSYVSGEHNGLNRLLDSFIRYSIRKQYKPNNSDLMFEFNLNSVTENAKGLEIGDNEFVLTIPEVVASTRIKFTDGLPKERALKLIALAKKYFANIGDSLILRNDRENYIYMDVKFDFEKYRPHFIEQLHEIIDNELKNSKFESETAKSNKGVVITIKPEYYNLDIAEDSLTKSSADFRRKTRFVYEDDTYLRFASDIIASMTSYVTGATSGRIKGDYELKVPVTYNVTKVGYGVTRNGDGIEILARSLHDGFTAKSDAFTNYIEYKLSTPLTELFFHDDGSYSWYFSKDKAEGVCAYASSRIAEFIESYCNKNNIPVYTHADHKGLEIIINNTDITE